MERVVKVGAEIVGAPPQRGAQVGAAYVADEQSVAGENGVRLGRIFVEIEHEDRDRLDSVAGGLEHLQAMQLVNAYDKPYQLKALTSIDAPLGSTKALGPAREAPLTVVQSKRPKSATRNATRSARNADQGARTSRTRTRSMEVSE